MATIHFSSPGSSRMYSIERMMPATVPNTPARSVAAARPMTTTTRGGGSSLGVADADGGEVGVAGTGRVQLAQLELDAGRRPARRDRRQHGAGDALQQLVGTRSADLDDHLAHVLVVHGVGEPVGLQRAAHVERQIDVDLEAPSRAPLAGGGAVVGLELDVPDLDDAVTHRVWWSRTATTAAGR